MSQVDRPVGPRPSRRRFSAEFKARVVAEYGAAGSAAQRGAILRREGLYDSHIQKWRAAAQAGRLRDTPVAGSGSMKVSRERDLAAENAKLRAELDMTKSMLEVMGKAHALLETISKSAPGKQP